MGGRHRACGGDSNNRCGSLFCGTPARKTSPKTNCQKTHAPRARPAVPLEPKVRWGRRLDRRDEAVALPACASTPTCDFQCVVVHWDNGNGGEALSTCLVLPITASSSSSLKRGRRRRCYSGTKTRPQSSLPLTMMKMAQTSIPSRWPTELQYFCGAGLLVPTPGTHNSIFSHSWRKG